jgi:hypothetical protein
MYAAPEEEPVRGTAGNHTQPPSARPAKDGEGRCMTTETENDSDVVGQHLARMREGGELAFTIEPRCRICRRPDLRAKVNEMLAGGYTLAAILDTLEPVNASLPRKSQITSDSLHKHRVKHFNLARPAAALWRRILEERVAAESADYESGVVSLLTPAAFFTTMMQRGFETMINEATTISVDQGLAAARELGKLTPQGDDELKWARAHAQLNRVVAVMRELPPEYQEMVVAKLEGRPGPPPTGGGRLAVIEGGKVTEDDDGFDPLDGGDDDFDDED